MFIQSVCIVKNLLGNKYAQIREANRHFYSKVTCLCYYAGCSKVKVQVNEVAGELLFELFEPTVKTKFVNTVLTCVAVEIRLLWYKTLADQFSKVNVTKVKIPCAVLKLN